MEAILEARRHIDNAKGFLSNNAKKKTACTAIVSMLKLPAIPHTQVFYWLLMNYWEKKRRKKERVSNGTRKNYQVLIKK